MVTFLFIPPGVCYAVTEKRVIITGGNDRVCILRCNWQCPVLRCHFWRLNFITWMPTFFFLPKQVLNLSCAKVRNKLLKESAHRRINCIPKFDLNVKKAFCETSKHAINVTLNCILWFTIFLMMCHMLR